MADGKWHITHSIRHLPSAIRHPAYGMRHLPSGIWHLTSGIRHLTFAICHSVFNPSWALADDPTGRSLACRPGQSLHPLSADQLANRLAAIDDLHRTAPRGRVLGVDVGLGAYPE